MGWHVRSLVKTSRWLSARYAMIRHGISSKIIEPVQVSGKANVADILTKPITGKAFIAHRDTILGLHLLGGVF